MNATAYKLPDPLPTANCRIYVADLAAYNAGNLRGIWIDCDGKTAEDITTEVREMLWKSPESNILAIRCNDCDFIQHYGFGQARAYAQATKCPECDSKDVEKSGSAEEWAIHDHEGLGSISEYESFDTIEKIAEGVNKHGEAFVAYIEHVGSVEDGANFEEAYCGEWSSEKEYAEDLFDQTMEVPDHLANYIDYDAFRYDLFMDGYFSIERPNYAGIWVFSNV